MNWSEADGRMSLSAAFHVVVLCPTCVGVGPLEVRYPEKGNSLGVEYSAKLTKIKKSVRLLININSYVKGLNYLRFINCIFAG